MSIPDGTTPFTQTDFSVPYGIRSSEGFADQAIWALATPFNQLDWSKPFFPKFAKSPITQAINLLLYKNPVPFGPFDYNKSRWTPPAKEQPNWSLNLNLYKNPIPFGPYDWNKATVPSNPIDPITQALNINLFKNPIPILNVDYSKPFFPKSVDALDAGYNLNLYISVVSTPFNKTDWSTTQFIGGKPGLSDQSIWYLTPPFSQTYWPKPFTQWYRPAQIDGAIIDATQPFSQTNWDKTTSSRIVPSVPSPLNLNLYVTVQVPFNQTNWPAVSALKATSAIVQPVNSNLYSVVISVPFNQTDWTTSTRLRSNISDLGGRNPNLFSEVPFFPIDWSQSQRLPTSLQLILPNIVLLNPVINPFYTQDFSKTQFLPSVPQPPSGMALNINLFSNPFPFNQYDWTKLWYIRPIVSDQSNLPNFALFNPSIPSSPLGIFSWTDWSFSQGKNNFPKDFLAPNLTIILPPGPPPPPEFVPGGKWVHQEPKRFFEPKKVQEDVIKPVPLKSSNIKEITYDKDEKELEVVFKTYKYKGVSPKRVKGLLNADSHGKYFHNKIKNKYPTTRTK